MTRSTNVPPPQYYMHSGVVPAGGIVAGILVGAMAAIVGGTVYGYADHFINFIYIRVIITIAFGWLVGAAPARAMLKANVRNVGAVLMIAGLSALFGYYVAWIAWICAIFQGSGSTVSATHLVTSPAFLLRVVQRCYELGVWGLQTGATVTGPSLGFIWLIEFGTILITALVVARKLARKRPFCESCGKWADVAPSIADTSYLEPADLKQRLESRQFDIAARLPRYNGGAGPYLSWDINQCAACKEFNTLTVTRVKITRDRRGRVQKRKKVLIDKLLISTLELVNMRTKLVAPPAQATLPTAPSVSSTAPAIPPPPVVPNFPRSTNEELLDL